MLPRGLLEPPEPSLPLILAIASALFAALFATVSSAVSAIPPARRAALQESLTGARKRSISRYVAQPFHLEVRWLVLRVVGIATSAALMSRALPHINAGLIVAIVIIAYALPAELASAFARRTAEFSAPWLLALLRPFELVVAPIATPMFFMGRLVAGTIHQAPSSSLVESEVEILVNQGEEAGSLAHDQSQMIRNVLDFGDVRAGDIMVPRTQVTSIEVETPLTQVLDLISEKGHSRYPVYRDSIDNVIGILHVKDVMAQVAQLDSLKVTDLMRPQVVYVAESQLASSVLTDMRAGRRQHLAIVIDEFGGMSGIITLEDLLEEIVGDIRDEHDREEPQVIDLGNGKFLADASVPIADLSRQLGVELPDDGDYHSLGGFIVESVGRVPSEGEVIKKAGLNFVVRDADERHVVTVEILRGPDSVPRSSPRPAA